MQTVIVILLSCFIIVRGSTVHELQYGEGPEGPSHWPGLCATGLRQSPIDISPDNVIPSIFSDLKFTNYNKEGSVEILNLGETLQVRGFEKWNNLQPVISGGGLKGKYKLLQLHFHWSDSDENGSEHTIQGTHFPLEIHFVHVKENRTLQQALLEPDGLMVLGVFGTITFDTHHLSSLMPGLKVMENSTVGTHIDFKIIPEQLLPLERLSFYRYEGSLTTPECEESVIWTILPAPISMSRSQMAALQKIRKSQHLEYSTNLRPIQKLNGRKIHFRLRIAHITAPTKSRTPRQSGPIRVPKS
ncbi:hypothetical protein FO519_009132 [Halicephalobus sp. NKZ332]|nr:hypothetical protein FO519_009132 [Halicephalobus sp. NKZ332]